MRYKPPTESDFTPLIALFNARRYAELEDKIQVLLVEHPNAAFAWQLLGGALQMQGKDALAAFQKVVSLSPNDAVANFNLGVAYKSAGQLELAAASYRHTLKLRPNYIEALSNLGGVLHDLTQLDEAVICYQKCIHLRPNYPDAYYNLGNVYRDLKQLHQAAQSYQQAVKIKPNFTGAYCNLGCVLKELGDLNEAVVHFQHAIATDPMFVEAHRNLAGLFRELGQFEEAVRCYQNALEIQPDSAEVLSHLALAYYDLKQFDQAIALCEHALTLDSHHADAHNNLGLSYKAIGQLDRAISCYQRAIGCNPNIALSYSNLGNALKDVGQYENAITNYLYAISLKPDFAEAHNNLGIALSSLGEHHQARISYRRALDIKPHYFEAHSNLLMAATYTLQSPADYLDEALRFGKNVAGKTPSRYAAWQCNPQPPKLRVGVVSADLHSHPVGYFLESLLAQLDSARIELIAYTNNPINDDLTARIKPYFSAWKSVFALNDQAAAQLIHEDGIHVLLDLSGHTAHNRLPLFAWKPAPVQVTWLGYFASTGVAGMDYLLADATGVPESQRANFSEQIWYLPDTRLCFTPPDTDLPVAALPGLTNGFVTFGCLQNLAKINDDVLITWGRILAALPHARLRLASKQLNDPTVVAQLQQRLQQYGISPARVSMHGPVSRAAYLAAYAEVDVLLDTFPFPGGTTTCEALWMGVPTLTLAGETLLARQGASLLTAAGLQDWIAASEEAYVAKAVHFAGDLPKLATLRANLREQVRISPLFDAPRFAKHFEEALWGMWQAHDRLLK